MKRELCSFKEIGYAVTPYKEQSGTPIQPGKGKQVNAEIHIYSGYREGLSDLDEFERIWILSYFHLSTGYKLKVIPYRDTVLRGLFSTRAPRRPNPIGLSLVELLSVDQETGILQIRGIDLLDGTPILDIKPYVPVFECFPESHAGWLDRTINTQTADSRFGNEK